MNQTRRPTPYHFDCHQAFTSTLQTKSPTFSSCASFPQDSPTEVIQHQRRLIRSAHFARNQWVKPSLHCLTLIQEYIADLKQLEGKNQELSARSAAYRQEEKERIINKLEDLTAIQLEEVKGTELNQYNKLVQEELFRNYQLLPTTC